MSVGIKIKESSRKIKHPNDDPARAKKLAVGKANYENMMSKFENQAARSDYLKRVAANPMNVPGRPAFYPPLELKSAMGGVRAARKCTALVEGEVCGGCCTYLDNYQCPRCGKDNSTEN